MQIRNEARTKIEKLRSLKGVKASGGKILLSLNPWAERKGGVWGSVRLERAINSEGAPAIRMGMAVVSNGIKPIRGQVGRNETDAQWCNRRAQAGRPGGAADLLARKMQLLS